MCTLGPNPSRASSGPATEWLPMCTLPASSSRHLLGSRDGAAANVHIAREFLARPRRMGPQCAHWCNFRRVPAKGLRRNRGECASRGEKIAGSVRFSRRQRPQCAHYRGSCRAPVHTPAASVARPCVRATGWPPMCTLSASPSHVARPAPGARVPMGRWGQGRLTQGGQPVMNRLACKVHMKATGYSRGRAESMHKPRSGAPGDGVCPGGESGRASLCIDSGGVAE